MKHLIGLLAIIILSWCTQQTTTHPTISQVVEQTPCTQWFCVSKVDKKQLMNSWFIIPGLSSNEVYDYDTYLVEDHDLGLHFYVSAYTKPNRDQIIKTSDNKYIKLQTGSDRQQPHYQYIQVFQRQYPDLTLEEEINQRFVGDSDICEVTTNGSEISIIYKPQYQQDVRTWNPIPSSGTWCNKEYIRDANYTHFWTIRNRSDIFYYMNKWQEWHRWSELFDINDPICNIATSMTMWWLSVERNHCPGTEANEYLSYATWYEWWSWATLTVINHVLNNSGTETLSPLAIRYPNQQTTSQLLNYIQSSWCELSWEDTKYVQPNNTYQQQIDAIVQKVESQGQQSLTTQEQAIYSNLLTPCFGDWGTYEPLGSWLLWTRNMKNWWGTRWAYITNISLE